MASKAGQKRLIKEYKSIEANPVPYIQAKPNDSNVLEWHYIISGPPDTPYFGGQYHGTLTFPSDYPFNPPAIRMITPNGRFVPNSRICLSMSDFHPDSWNPTWSVSTILTGLLSFMTGDENTTGSMTTDIATKKLYARSSKNFNNNHPVFKRIFPDVVKKNLEQRSVVTESEHSSSVTKQYNENDNKNTRDTIEIYSGPEEEDNDVEIIDEKPVNLDMINNPEDRIRARALKEKAAEETSKHQKRSNTQTHKSVNLVSSSLLISIAFLVVIIGMGSTIAKGLIN